MYAMQQNFAVLDETIVKVYLSLSNYTDSVIRFHTKLQLLIKVMVTLKKKVRIWSAAL